MYKPCQNRIRFFGGFLFGFFFAFAAFGAVCGISEVHRNGKRAVVIGTRDAHRFITGTLFCLFLIQFLKQRFIIFRAAVVVHFFDFGDEKRKHVFFGGRIARVEKVRADDRFHAVGENGGLLPAAAQLLAVSQNEHFIDTEAERDRRKRFFRNDDGFDPR